ncbi:hypothetical protein [Paenibacillus tyrfis]|uniref:hypothetical protein n=1 Tax=Paenibacillus tyrfis TaxID=1501230 RepID=UPI00209E84CA|nr:hypothetical protein [Paenibacillus tyrfis]MCP1309368.1 hypothetical protein [Paenibacillus tyrfis]
MVAFLVKTVFTTIEFFAMVLLVLSSFRIYFRYALHKVFFIAIILSLISFYVRDYLGQFNLAYLSILASEIVLIMLFFRLPIIFSFFMCIIANIATATFEGLVAAIGIQMNLTSEQLIQTNLVHSVVWQLIVTALQVLLIIFLQRYKIGFHFTINDSMKKYNFWLSGILILSVCAIQVQTMIFKESKFHIAIPVSLAVVFLTGIVLAYKHNQKLWKERRERLSKR